MIETHRLLLRPFVTQDAADLLEYRREPLVNCFVCMKLNTLEEARAEAEKLAAQPESCLAIVLKNSGKVIGEIEGHPESANPEEDAPADTVSPCWMLHRDYQGKGYAFEAAQAFFDYLFQDKDIRRIYAYTEDYNHSCQRLCEKLGMRREGLFLEFVSFVTNPDGTPLYENTFQYAILKKEWLARK